MRDFTLEKQIDNEVFEILTPIEYKDFLNYVDIDFQKHLKTLQIEHNDFLNQCGN